MRHAEQGEGRIGSLLFLVVLAAAGYAAWNVAPLYIANYSMKDKMLEVARQPRSTNDEKVRACEMSMKAGADYVKTSTGFSSGGATAEDIRLMARSVAPKKLGVKASGGVRTYDDAVKMIAAGATRIGASASVKIVDEARARASRKG
jgi:deoxyribose-phosphate aldolase